LAGLIGLTPSPWTITASAAVLGGSGAVLVDILFFDNSVSTRSRRLAITTLAVLAGMSALTLSFAIGRATASLGTGHTYTLVAVGQHPNVYGLPDDRTNPVSYVQYFGHLEASCYLLVDGVRWYRVPARSGWVSGSEFEPEPHNGQGNVPTCSE